MSVPSVDVSVLVTQLRAAAEALIFEPGPASSKMLRAAADTIEELAKRPELFDLSITQETDDDFDLGSATRWVVPERKLTLSVSFGKDLCTITAERPQVVIDAGAAAALRNSLRAEVVRLQAAARRADEVAEGWHQKWREADARNQRLIEAADAAVEQSLIDTAALDGAYDAIVRFMCQDGPLEYFANLRVDSLHAWLDAIPPSEADAVRAAMPDIDERTEAVEGRFPASDAKPPADAVCNCEVVQGYTSYTNWPCPIHGHPESRTSR